MYRLLKKEGLVKPPVMQLVAGKEYQRKTSGPHQMWATDASYFRVTGWGYYYMVTVMDDYSRSILAWKLQEDMTSDSLIQVIQLAVDVTGMTEVPLEDRTKLLSDNESGYVSRAFRDYPGLFVTTWAWWGSVISGRRLTIHKPTGNWSGTIKASRTR